MLVLTRGVDEKLIIGQQEIVIKILEVRKGQVRLGIEADRNVPIHREEIWKRICAEKAVKQAACATQVAEVVEMADVAEGG